MSDFLAMGGYAAYVWPSFAVFFIVLAFEALAPRAQRKRILASIRGRIRRERDRKPT